jgi:hypothetical protein
VVQKGRITVSSNTTIAGCLQALYSVGAASKEPQPPAPTSLSPRTTSSGPSTSSHAPRLKLLPRLRFGALSSRRASSTCSNVAAPPRSSRSHMRSARRCSARCWPRSCARSSAGLGLLLPSPLPQSGRGASCRTPLRTARAAASRHSTSAARASASDARWSAAAGLTASSSGSARRRSALRAKRVSSFVASCHGCQVHWYGGMRVSGRGVPQGASKAWLGKPGTARRLKKATHLEAPPQALLARLPPCHAEQGPHELHAAAAPRVAAAVALAVARHGPLPHHRRQPVRAAAPYRVEQQRLGAVAGGVAGRDAAAARLCGERCKRAVAPFARLRLRCARETGAFERPSLVCMRTQCVNDKEHA